MEIPITRAGAKRFRVENSTTVSSDCPVHCKRKITSLELENSQLVKKCNLYEEKLTRVEMELQNFKTMLFLEQNNKEVGWSHWSCGEGCVESPWLQRTDHPLMNDVILSSVFEYVRKHDMKVCRGVCKKWNELAIPVMRSKFEVKICGDESDSDSNSESSNTTDTTDTRRIEDFVDLFGSNTLGIPFAKYRFLGALRNTNEVLTQFLKISGPTANEIHLVAEHYDCRETFLIEDISEILRSSPKLEYLGLPEKFDTHSAVFFPCSKSAKQKSNSVKSFLPGLESSKSKSKSKFPHLKKLKFGKYSYDRGLEKCPTFIQELFTAAPNICDVEVHDGFGDKNSLISSVFDVIEKLGKESSIESLHLFNSRTNHLEVLQKFNGLKLRRLTFTHDFTSRDNMDGIVLSKLFKNTLEYFDLTDHSYYGFTEFPRMPKLKSLAFRLSSKFTPCSIKLNNILPALETLELKLEYTKNGRIYNDDFHSQFDQSCIPNITSLTLENVNMKPIGLRNFLRVFPKLMKLKLSLNLHHRVNGVDVLRMIWTEMTQLEELDIEFDTAVQVDSALTGITSNIYTLQKIDIESLRLEKMTIEDRLETIERLRNEYCRFPSITNLTNLRLLRLRNPPGRYTEGCCLTDLTGYLALCPMKHLNRLTVEASHFTTSCCEVLTTDMGLEYWTFSAYGVIGSDTIIPSQI